MIDPDFDPYAELQEAQDMINKLIMAHNNHDELLVQYSKQAEQVAKLLNSQQRQINNLKFEVKQLQKNEIK